MPFPIASSFQVISKAKGHTLVAGDLFLFGETFHVSYGNPTPGFGHMWSAGATKARFTRSSTSSALGMTEYELSELVLMGPVEATLKLVPSLRAARGFERTSEFWGGEITYDVTFQAFDSSGTR
jgi:hypothetical protein